MFLRGVLLVATAMKLQNSDMVANLDGKLGHLSDNVKCDVDMGDHEVIKQHPYRVNPLKRAYLNKEIEYMLQNNIIEQSKSEWSSPCILVP